MRTNREDSLKVIDYSELDLLERNERDGLGLLRGSKDYVDLLDILLVEDRKNPGILLEYRLVGVLPDEDD